MRFNSHTNVYYITKFNSLRAELKKLEDLAKDLSVFDEELYREIGRLEAKIESIRIIASVRNNLSV